MRSTTTFFLKTVFALTFVLASQASFAATCSEEELKAPVLKQARSYALSLKAKEYSLGAKSMNTKSTLFSVTVIGGECNDEEATAESCNYSLLIEVNHLTCTIHRMSFTQTEDYYLTTQDIYCLTNEELKTRNELRQQLAAAKLKYPGCETSYGAASCLGPFNEMVLENLEKKKECSRK